MKMKIKVKSSRIITSFALVSISPLALAGGVVELPEPSTLGLFVAATVAITLLVKLKK